VPIAAVTASVTAWWRPHSGVTAVPVVLNAVLSPVSGGNQTFSSAPDAVARFGEIGQRFAIDGAGTDVWVGADNYSAIYLPGSVTTSSTVQTEVTGQQGMGGYAKAGIMVRNSVSGSGPEGVILFESPSGGIQLEWNDNGGLYIDNVTPANGTISDVVPVWLRLVRSGAVYTGYYSLDGSAWTLVGSATVPGQAGVQDAGLFMTSHSPGSPGLVYYDGFSVSG
jgi:alpha-galactosidase